MAPRCPLSAKPIPELTLMIGGDYLHAYYTNFSFTVPAGYLLPASGAYNLTGTPFPLPQRQVNASVDYTLTGDQIGLPIGSLSLMSQAYVQSHFMADTLGFNQRQSAQGYHMINFRVDVENIYDSNISLAGFVTNALDAKACQPESGDTGTGAGAGLLNSAPIATNGTPGTSGLLQCIPLPPRMFGVTARYTFGAPPPPAGSAEGVGIHAAAGGGRDAVGSA